MANGTQSESGSKIKSFFGIHSPSTVFRDEIGKNLMLGLANGITGNEGVVSMAMSRVANGLSNTNFAMPNIVSGNVFKLNTTIPGDLDADGFTVTDSFNIRIKITDELSPSTYVMTLGSGTPGLAIHKNGIAIN